MSDVKIKAEVCCLVAATLALCRVLTWGLERPFASAMHASPFHLQCNVRDAIPIVPLGFSDKAAADAVCEQVACYWHLPSLRMPSLSQPCKGVRSVVKPVGVAEVSRSCGAVGRCYLLLDGNDIIIAASAHRATQSWLQAQHACCLLQP